MVIEVLATVFGGVLGGAGLVGVMEYFRDRKAKKQVCANEAAKGQVDLLGQMMDLVRDYGEKMQRFTESNTGSNEEVVKQLEQIRNDIIDIKREQSDLREFLNGDYRKFLNAKYGKTN